MRPAKDFSIIQLSNSRDFISKNKELWLKSAFTYVTMNSS